ncbi:MAG: tyrosine--tRNA ligase [Candidatus Zambryskibacteria bacterium CG11_big_fil_rev_8_21_14_0_20_40_24]|uniref:Tyrosine--tRNA ligase n=1 Tax=Candidatus Zambryskibacteria bacterium CG11_big_fil_rev_8_21_14_0_20_40_24 TaxID=1975116 RepID=A0A2H0K8Y2_9BACT|nr:MAG: tyrosine--tRNA ligase [Candidatus Zambryskibacteria bacterium CG11_big_fil_rev_8_21_14_0_20_40_24]
MKSEINNKIDTNSPDLLKRGIREFIDPEGEFQKKLETNPKAVVIKFGVDPTRPDIHIGHAVILRKLRQFQDMGCKVIFLIGDFTSLIGDPTGNSKVRPEISQKEIESNMKTYLDQVGKILKTTPDVFSWIRNSDWFLSISDLLVSTPVTYTDNTTKASVTFAPNSFFAKTAVYDSTRMQKTHLNKNQIHDVTPRTFISTLRFITHSRLINRDMFQERIRAGEELYMHEMIYPILQGLDSSILERVYGACDLEVGGTDQTFNMLIGRDIMRLSKQKPQAVLSFDILEGLDGKEKMSKSLNNYIAITDSPDDMYGKVMSIPDTSIVNYFTLCTYSPLVEIKKLEDVLKKGKENPMNIKKRLAREIVEIYHGKKLATDAEKNFIKTFSKKEIPDNTKEIKTKTGTTLVDALVNGGVVASKNEFKRLLDGKAIEFLESGEIIGDYNRVVDAGGTLRIGKKRFVKIIIE